MLGDPRHEVVFVGYQARGTPGALLQAGAGAKGSVRIDLDGRIYPVRLKILTLHGFAGHADQCELVKFALAGQTARRVLLVHGEVKSKRALSRAIRDSCRHERTQIEVLIPE